MSRAIPENIVSSKLWPVSMCKHWKRSFAGKNAFLAKCTNVIDPFHPKKV
jgi:hypothetical protein